MHKLSSPWEGPYMVKEVTRLGSNWLCDLDGINIPNLWHIEHLIRFYPWNALDMYSSLHNEWSFCRHNLSPLFLYSSLISTYDYQLRAAPLQTSTIIRDLHKCFTLFLHTKISWRYSTNHRAVDVLLCVPWRKPYLRSLPTRATGSSALCYGWWAVVPQSCLFPLHVHRL